MADLADLQLPEKALADRHPPAEQPDGALVTHALPHASCLPKVRFYSPAADGG